MSIVVETESLVDCLMSRPSVVMTMAVCRHSNSLQVMKRETTFDCIATCEVEHGLLCPKKCILNIPWDKNRSKSIAEITRISVIIFSDKNVRTYSILFSNILLYRPFLDLLQENLTAVLLVCGRFNYKENTVTRKGL